MPRRENDSLEARNQQLDARLLRNQQAFRALERLDETIPAR